jgi:glycosyltransferase involved in cell wall biosynthesis
MPQLSVILISRNQEWNMARLIESVLEHITVTDSSEVVLVDSASTDRNVEIASQYPIGIIRLHADQRLTAAAGRYTGYQHTSGEYVLFLDGDMELLDGWLEPALETFKNNPDIAVVTGRLIDRPMSTPREDKLPVEQPAEITLKDVKHGGGAAMYRRSVLDEVGSFNPYIISDEEPELCVRIRHQGYRVVMLNRTIAFHYSDPSDAMSTLIARWRRRLYLGAGQNLRQNWGKSSFWLYVKERGFGLIPAVGVLVGILLLLLSIVTGNWLFFGVWLLLLLMMIALDTLRKGSLYRALYSLLLRLLIMDGTIRGFFLKPMNPEKHPLKFTIVEQTD